MIVRRELSDNFCFYNPKYDSIEGAATWAQTTLNDHKYVNLIAHCHLLSIITNILYALV